MPDNRVQAKVILLNKDNKILLAMRSEYSDRRANEWELIGGGVDVGESPEAAASREIFEETGLQVAVNTHDLVYALTRMPANGVNVTWLTYVVHTDQDDIRLSEEHTAFKWATIDEVFQTIVYDVQLQALRHAYEHDFVS